MANWRTNSATHESAGCRIRKYPKRQNARKFDSLWLCIRTVPGHLTMTTEVTAFVNNVTLDGLDYSGSKRWRWCRWKRMTNVPELKVTNSIKTILKIKVWLANVWNTQFVRQIKKRLSREIHCKYEVGAKITTNEQLIQDRFHYQYSKLIAKLPASVNKRLNIRLSFFGKKTNNFFRIMNTG